MANPHHRKKRKHFTPPPHQRKQPKGGASSIMAIFGAIIGVAIFYFAVQASVIWIIVGSITLGIIGYLIGKRMDGTAIDKK